MRQTITMPALSDTMNNGRLVKWVKKPGDAIRKGETIAEVETDKAIMEVEAFHDGFLSGPLAAEGAELPVGQPIGYIADTRAESEGTAQSATAAAVPNEAPAPALAAAAPRRDGGGVLPQPARPPAAAAASVRASPYARRMAQQLGVDLAKIAAGQSNVRADAVLSAAREAPRSWLDAGPPYRIERMTSVREAIARNMIASLATPTFRVNAELPLAALGKAAADQQVSFTLFLARACALTVQALPLFNAAYTPEGLALRERVDVGVAVDAPDGLVALVLRDVAARPIGELAADWRALREKLDRRRLAPQDYQGATFYLSNLGTFPVVHSFDAVLPLGATAILCVGAPQAKRTAVTLACDHRVVAGADAARFLQRLSEVCGDPRAWSGTAAASGR